MRLVKLRNGYLAISKDRDVMCWAMKDSGTEGPHPLCTVDCAAFRIKEPYTATGPTNQRRIVLCLALPREHDGLPTAIAELAETVNP